MDRSLFDVILYTCKNTEIPPKPSRNAERIMFILIDFMGIIEICLIPLVISNIPVKMGVQKLVSKFNILNMGELISVNVLKIPLVFSIDMMLEKMIINPPIIRIVFVLLVMLSDRILPRFDIVILSVLDVLGFFIEFFDSWLDLLKSLFLLFVSVCCVFVCFLVLVSELFLLPQKRNSIPTLIHPNMCVIKSKTPICVFPNILIPTVPIINRGPELFVKLNSLSHSGLEQIFLFLNSVAILAPTGYPLINPIIKQKAPLPDILNNGFIILFSSLPKNDIIEVCSNSSVATKNGNRDGTTEVAHNVSPVFIAGRLFFENSRRHIANIRKMIAKRFLLIFNTKKWHFENILSPSNVYALKC